MAFKKLCRFPLEENKTQYKRLTHCVPRHTYVNDGHASVSAASYIYE